MGKAERRVPRAPPSRQMKKINSKPKCPDEQEIPYRLREIMKSHEELKNPKSKKKMKIVNKQWPDISEGDIPVPKFRRHEREAEASYVNRMERETQHVLFLTKNQLQREPEREELAQEKSQKKKEFQRKKMDKIRKQKEEKKAAMLEKELFKDSVKFGEVALQPPTLTAKPRKSKSKQNPSCMSFCSDLADLTFFQLPAHWLLVTLSRRVLLDKKHAQQKVVCVI
ncbi:coiled-coil domain-containing protein 137 isoform X4 [Sceloporus undulatus]|uniref:coiled-coil domain-containing protein 137 isoform X4 n=1 Tax=Sceloporus undulatus TaxID=8520 RepID=UPI001C4DC54E|nr:coiled-coil domain-containing protein 137 isoform X4 [Sceloporus undulatus]